MNSSRPEPQRLPFAAPATRSSALGVLLHTVRAQLSPREKKVWWAHAGRVLGVPESAGRPTPRPYPSILLLLAVCAAPFLGAGKMEAVVIVTSPTNELTVIRYGNNFPDPSNDQQTGSSEGDIVGNALHAPLYTGFNNAGTPSLTDGTLFFRLRLGADVNPVGFKSALFVGIDANRDGALDLFFGVNNSGSADTVGIWNPGTGLNISPSTTTIVSTPLVRYTPTASNYSWMPVNTTNDPSVGSALDLDGGGQNDYFLTFSIQLVDVITQLGNKGIMGVNENSIFTYVVSTATQANSLNQDLNGVGKNYDGSLTWAALGALSDPFSASGLAVVPEPSTAALAGVGLIVLFVFAARSTTRAKRGGNARVSL